MITNVRIVTASCGLENWSQNSHTWFCGRLAQYHGYGMTIARTTSTGIQRLARSGIRRQPREISSLARPTCAVTPRARISGEGWLCHQAPSGVRSPRRPSGRKTRIMIRIAKTIERVQSPPGAFHERPSLNAWISPIRTPPRTAPGRLPIPPSDRGSEGDQAEREPRVVADVELDQEERRADARERAGERRT